MTGNCLKRAPDSRGKTGRNPAVLPHSGLDFPPLNFKGRKCVSWIESCDLLSTWALAAQPRTGKGRRTDVLQLLWQGDSRRCKSLRLLRQAGGRRDCSRKAGTSAPEP